MLCDRLEGQRCIYAQLPVDRRTYNHVLMTRVGDYLRRLKGVNS